MSFVLGIVSNILANLVFWLLLGASFWIASRVVVRRFFRFFGLDRTSSIGVYLSNLWTPQPSQTGRTVGYSISLHELRAAQAVEKLFGSAPLRLPEVVRGLVDALWLRQQLQYSTDVSPLKAIDADLDRNLIVVGGSARNSIRARYVQAQIPNAILTGEDQVPINWAAIKSAQSITIMRGGSKSEISLADTNLAVVEKCHDPERETVIFFCLGMRADTSWAAAEYLIRNWKHLAAEFGDSNFVVCLGFPKTEEYLDAYKEPLRLSMGGRR